MNTRYSTSTEIILKIQKGNCAIQNATDFGLILNFLLEHKIYAVIFYYHFHDNTLVIRVYCNFSFTVRLFILIDSFFVHIILLLVYSCFFFFQNSDATLSKSAAAVYRRLYFLLKHRKDTAAVASVCQTEIMEDLQVIMQLT